MPKPPKRALDRLRAATDEQGANRIEVRHMVFTFPDVGDPAPPAPAPSADPSQAAPAPRPGLEHKAPRPARAKPAGLCPGDALPMSDDDPSFDAPGGFVLARHLLAHRLGVHPSNVSPEDVERFFRARHAAAAQRREAAAAREQRVDREQLLDEGWRPLRG